MSASLIVYRRDHCGYCFSLERALKNAGVPYDRRDIWSEPKYAEFVRSVNNGNETVPTVVIDGTDVRVNPRPADLLRAMGVEPPPTLWHRITGGRNG